MGILDAAYRPPAPMPPGGILGAPPMPPGGALGMPPPGQPTGLPPAGMPAQPGPPPSTDALLYQALTGGRQGAPAVNTQAPAPPSLLKDHEFAALLGSMMSELRK